MYDEDGHKNLAVSQDRQSTQHLVHLSNSLFVAAIVVATPGGLEQLQSYSVQ